MTRAGRLLGWGALIVVAVSSLNRPARALRVASARAKDSGAKDNDASERQRGPQRPSKQLERDETSRQRGNAGDLSGEPAREGVANELGHEGVGGAKGVRDFAAQNKRAQEGASNAIDDARKSFDQMHSDDSLGVADKEQAWKRAQGRVDEAIDLLHSAERRSSGESAQPAAQSQTGMLMRAVRAPDSGFTSRVAFSGRRLSLRAVFERDAIGTKTVEKMSVELERWAQAGYTAQAIERANQIRSIFGEGSQQAASVDRAIAAGAHDWLVAARTRVDAVRAHPTLEQARGLEKELGQVAREALGARDVKELELQQLEVRRSLITAAWEAADNASGGGRVREVKDLLAEIVETGYAMDGRPPSEAAQQRMVAYFQEANRALVKRGLNEAENVLRGDLPQSLRLTKALHQFDNVVTYLNTHHVVADKDIEARVTRMALALKLGLKRAGRAPSPRTTPALYTEVSERGGSRVDDVMALRRELFQQVGSEIGTNVASAAAKLARFKREFDSVLKRREAEEVRDLVDVFDKMIKKRQQQESTGQAEVAGAS
jgi:hypothetical protein